jgi:hypothetical protein
MNYYRLTDRDLDARIMYLIQYGRDIQALDNALSERLRRVRIRKYYDGVASEEGWA